MAQAFHALENLWDYNGPPTHPPAVFTKKVFAAEDRLLAAICAFNQQILAQSLTPPESASLAEVGRKVDVVLARQDATGKAVRRLEAPDRTARRKTRQRFSVEVQEAAYGYWMRGRDCAAVRQFADSRRKVSRANVFAYFRKELAALGIRDADTFDQVLRLRTKRISRTQER